ncbi:MAG: amidohydrolase family protein, partial [Nevskiaceae bacterium]
MRTLLCAALLFAGAPALAADVLIKNAKIHTAGPAGTIASGSVLVRDGRIAAVGGAVAAPKGAQVIDGTGLVVTPGVFAAYTQLGLREIDGIDETADDASKDKRFSASLDVVDGLNPRAAIIAIDRAEGVTRAVAAPQTDHDALLAGLGAVVNLGSIDRFVMRPRAAMYLTAGEGGAQLIGGSRPASYAWLREAFEEVRNPKLWQGRPSREPLLSPLEAEALKPVLAGQVPLVAQADRASDLRTLMKLASDYRLRLVIQGGAEAHLVARELAQRGIPVVLDPSLTLPQRFESLATVEDNAARLQRAGVVTAFMSDDMASQDARNLRQLAGIAVQRGMPWDAALASITINPAKIFGVDREVGSIVVGKAADLVVWDGDPFELRTWPRHVFIDGRAVPAETRQTKLRDRYLKRLQP